MNNNANNTAYQKRNIIKVAAAMINDDGELLIVRKKNSEIYINPGGRIEHGESHIDCLARELKEELQVNLVDARYFKTYYTDSAAHDPDCSLTFHLYIVKWKGEIKPASEIVKAVWLTKNDLESGRYALAQLFSQTIPDLKAAGLLTI